MNNKEFVAELAKRMEITNDDAQKLVRTVIDAMGDNFQADNAILIPSFGNFEIKKKMERIMVNPGTQQRMLVPPKLVLSFKPNTTWKEKLKTGDK